MHEKSERAPEAQEAPNAGSKRKHLKATELGQEFNVSRRTILNWHALGIIPASIAVGRVLRFDLDACREALERHSNSDA